MGEPPDLDTAPTTPTGHHRTPPRPDDVRARHRHHLARSLQALDALVHRDALHRGPATIGLEAEMALVDPHGHPHPGNDHVVTTAGARVQRELGTFTVEVNTDAVALAGDGLDRTGADLADLVHRVRTAAGDHHAHVVSMGVLASARPHDLHGRGWISPGPRYARLDAAVMAARGEDIDVDITGEEHLHLRHDSVALEALTSSTQVHLRVDPERFAPAWNAAQLVAGPQLAVAANSPFVLDHRLWAESRVPLFEQSVDPRPPELAACGVPPRVWFGDRWATGPTDLLAQNVRCFPALLIDAPDDPPDPLAQVLAGHVPDLHALRLHNGTVWRWNRPVYDPDHPDGPHLRLENRVLPAAPTPADAVADAAFVLGSALAWATAPGQVPDLPFALAAQNFTECARHGLRARVHWPGTRTRVPVTDLLLQVLLPAARAGLVAADVDPHVADAHLHLVRERCRTARTGHAWQTAQVHAAEHAGLDRHRAVTRMVLDYARLGATGAPVHTWPGHTT